MSRAVPFVLAACLLAPNPASAASADQRTMLEALGDADLRVATVGFKLVSANAPGCARLSPATGLVLHDLAQYSPELRPAARELFSLGAGLGVGSVVPGSPADRAGIRANDRIVAVNGKALLAGDGDAGNSVAASNLPFAAKLATLESELGQGSARLSLDRAAARFDVDLLPIQACATRFQLVPGREKNAWSDGIYVSLTTSLLDFVGGDDDQLAVVLSHELAHNILGHRARLKAEGVASGLLRGIGSNARKVKTTEIEADRLGLRLMHRAGYRLAAAEAFWRRFGAGSGMNLSTTHPGLKARIALVREVTEQLAARPEP